MNPWRLFGSLALLAAMTACDLAPNTPGSQEKGYPPVIADSADRREKAERDWRRLLETYNLPPTPPDLYPITYTPRSLLGVSGGIKFATLAASSESPNLAIREAAKGFIERWRELIGIDPAGISLAGVNSAGGATQLIYKQSDFPFPVSGDYGSMTLTVTGEGRLTQLDDKFIPLVELPSHAAVDKDTAVKRLIGKTFNVTGRDGRQDRVSVSSADVSNAQLVVLPVQKGNLLEVHLAWQFSAGKPPEAGMYVDAIKGQELRLADNSQP